MRNCKTNSAAVLAEITPGRNNLGMSKARIKTKLITDQNYLPELLKLLSRAKKRIDILSFSFAIGSAAGKINFKSAPFEIALKLKELKEKNGKKLKIRLFTEGLRETVSRNQVTAEYLQERGIEVRYGSTHAKGFCVDGKYLLFGSTNLTNQSILKNFEANLLIEDEKVAKEFTKYFNHHWKGGSHGDIELKPPLLPDGRFKDVLIDMIERARKNIEFSIYFFNHREIEAALVEAHERGVKLKGFIHQHASFAYSYIRANRATVNRMRKKGVKELYFGPRHTFSHAKYIVVDANEILLGTGNWLVEDVFIHPQLFIHLKDTALARKLSQHLAHEISHATDD